MTIVGNKAVARDEMAAYWDAGFRAAEATPGAFYDLKKLPAITQASHFRRMAMLDALPLGDLSDKVCVDYGVGPWGFACVFPKLHACAQAIGIDISTEAVRISERVSREGHFAYGDRVRYFAVSGHRLDLPDASVDVLFAGESIEHVFNVDAFLDEVHRVLKPEGRVIVTTPNADAVLYRAQGERYCHNGEHVSLMTYTELRQLVDARFDVTVARGFNGSFHRAFDDVADEAFAARWTAAFEDRPDLATGIVLMATPKPGLRLPRTEEVEIHHTSPQVTYTGGWEPCTLLGPLTAASAGSLDASATISWEGDGLIVFLWANPWGDHVRFVLDGHEAIVRTHSAVGGFLQQRWLDLADERHTLTMQPVQGGEAAARGHNLLLWKALGLRRR